MRYQSKFGEIKTSQNLDLAWNRIAESKIFLPSLASLVSDIAFSYVNSLGIHLCKNIVQLQKLIIQ